MLDSTPELTEFSQIPVLKSIPTHFQHQIELFRPKGGPIPPVDVRASEIATSWKAKIVGVIRYETADEIVHTYFAQNHKRRRKSSASAA